MDIPKPKYKIGDTVYAFTKDGLQPHKIERIQISISKESSSVRYSFEMWGDFYDESQLIKGYEKAKKRLEHNANQLVMLLD
jgi:hypothetical protein